MRGFVLVLVLVPVLFVACNTFGEIGFYDHVGAGTTGGPGPGPSSDPCPAVLGAPASPVWSRGYGDPSVQAADAVAVDNADNVIVTGYYQGTIDFGGGPLSGKQSGQAFVSKLDASGSHVWSKTLGDASGAPCTSVGVDMLGNVFVARNSSTSGGLLLAKLDPNGADLWSKTLGTGATLIYNLTLDEVGNVAVVGGFTGTVDFGGGTLSSDGAMFAAFVAVLDTNGNHLWSRSLANTDVQGVAFDASGNLVLTGGFVEVDFGGGKLTSVGGENAFIAGYDRMGGYLWSRAFPGGTAIGWAVAPDSSGNLLVTGELASAVDFGGGTLDPQGQTDILVLKLDAAGAHLWSKSFGAASPCQGFGRGIAVDSEDNVFIDGSFSCSVDFGGGKLTSAGGQDVLVASFDRDGHYRWAKRFGDTRDQGAFGLALDHCGHVLAVGSYESSVNFGGYPLTSAGLTDVFVSKFVR